MFDISDYFSKFLLMNHCHGVLHVVLYVQHLRLALPVNSVAEWIAYWIRYHSTVKPVFVRSLPARSS